MQFNILCHEFKRKMYPSLYSNLGAYMVKFHTYSGVLNLAKDVKKRVWNKLKSV